MKANKREMKFFADELKSKDCMAPFYCIIDKTKMTEADPRACGCATLATTLSRTPHLTK
jgi:hypothetical protein